MSNTWTNIVDKLEQELLSGSLETKEVEVGGMKRVFRSLDDIKDFLEYAKREAGLEQTASNRPPGRIQFRTRRHC